jgi:hypothetical protein
MTPASQFHSIVALASLIVFASGNPLRADNSVVDLSSPDTGLAVHLDKATGNYEVRETNPAWHFGGSLGQSLSDVTSDDGKDAVGNYQAISFAWQEGAASMRGEIRIYRQTAVVVFAETCVTATELPPAPFPSFTTVPEALHVFSYQQKNFAPPSFSANDCSTPWLLFDDAANALVISPASHFMVAAMIGDGHHQLASGLNPKLRNLPAGFTQQTILAYGHGINPTWDLWGKSLVAGQGSERPGNEADTILKYFGFWTDNGAYYYYNYDLAKGYQGTLESLMDHYRQEQIPVRYLQLDSWWYYKTFTDPDGKMGTTKAPKLPEGEWNRYGGLLEYKAHPALFPDGLSAFQQTIQLPLVTHNRWIDPASPYHQHYAISGVAAVDPKWWDDIATYLKASGIVTYEQDWLDRIYNYSPEFSSTTGAADAFLDNMARACKEKGITVQYCMPLPGNFMQGSRYPNLTTIRTSDDRFEPDRYDSFLYVSRLAQSMGIWPWADVFNSTETNNLLLATLSAGPVGVGDAMGRENKENILMSARSDGVLVKPDAAIVPLDQSYLADAQHLPAPLVAATDTDHNGYKTEYVFAFNRSKTHPEMLHFAPSELDLKGPVLVYDYFSGTWRRLNASDDYSATLEARTAAYYVVAPFGRSGIAFLGDQGKFVGTGKNRISSLKDEDGKLTATVLFAPDEKSVVLHGCSTMPLKVNTRFARVNFLKSDSATGYFQVEVIPDVARPVENINGDPARQITLTLTKADGVAPLIAGPGSASSVEP